MAELVRALHARAAASPESPGLIASLPGVPASRMAAACAELQRQGHAVREDMSGPPGKRRRTWVLAARNGDTDSAIAPGPLPQEPTVLVRASALPGAVVVARRTVVTVARREGASERVCSAIASAVTEACANVVVHAYGDQESPGDLEVRAGKVAGALIVEVVDEGHGLLPRRDAPGLGLGLGLLLIAQLADVLEIRTAGGRPGVAVRMRFDLEATEAIR